VYNILYSHDSKRIRKRAVFLGNSLERIKLFPEAAKARVGYQIFRLQCGEQPTDFKAIKSIGPGVYEIRVAVERSWYRAIYCVKFKDSVFILHAFQKKQNKTSNKDLRIARKALRELLNETAKQNNDE
jgi:phage-related protein